MDENIKTIITIIKHTKILQGFMLDFAQEIQKRAHWHDLSKFDNNEFEGFVKINKVAREHKYGSDEYKASLNAVQPNPIDLHYSNNSHHPEHYINGIDDMNLFDIIEMVCDWKAASETYGQTSFTDSVNISIERFSVNFEQIYLIKLVARELGYND